MSNEINKPESFAELFEQSLAQQEMRQGEVITAEVVRVDYNFVVVNAGLKSEAYVPIEEFKDDRGEVTVQPGDFVSVAIEAVENGYGDTILSRDKAKRLAAWMNLEQALESGELVTGTITGKVKGGLTVMTNGIRAFLPGSLVDTRPVKDTTPYEGNTYEFKVIKLDRKLIEAAQDLGAPTHLVFRRVIFPLSIPGVISGITMVFVPSVSTFVISQMLGSGKNLLVGDLIDLQFMGGAYNPHLGSAIALVMIILIFICMWIMNKFDDGSSEEGGLLL